MYIIKFTIYCIALVLLTTLPILIGGLLAEKFEKQKVIIAYITLVIYLAWFALLGIFGGFAKAAELLQKILYL